MRQRDMQRLLALVERLTRAQLQELLEKLKAQATAAFAVRADTDDDRHTLQRFIAAHAAQIRGQWFFEGPDDWLVDALQVLPAARLCG